MLAMNALLLDDGNPEDSPQSKGGRARASKLSKEQTKAIAIRASEARWGKDIPKAGHVGNLDLNGRAISAAVLPNGTRLITQGTFLLALGRSRTPKAGTGGLATVDELPFFLQADALSPYISEELRMSTARIIFRLPTGQKAVGYDARLLPMVCEVYLKLRDDYAERGQSVPSSYRHIVAACDLLMRAFAHVGIIALVDEATGYQDVRDRKALQEVLKQYIDGQLYKWTETFPIEFFKEICRLKGWPWNNGKMPGVTGKYINDLVYDRLAPGLLEELRRLNPKDDSGNKKHNHRLLTRDVGHPALLRRVFELTGMAAASETWEGFKKIVVRRFPRFNETPELPLD